MKLNGGRGVLCMSQIFRLGCGFWLLLIFEIGKGEKGKGELRFMDIWEGVALR